MKLLDLFSALLVPALALGSVVPSAAPGSELEEGLADLALASLNRRTNGCNPNNCARAVTGTNGLPVVTSKRADCSSFMRRTVSLTETTTVTAALERRQQTIVPSVIPSYVSQFCDVSKYSSACSCWGITATTTTVTSVATVTVAPPVVTHTGVLQVKRSDNDVVLGYVQPDLSYWTPQMTGDPNLALVVSFVAPSSSSVASKVDFKLENDNRGSFFGLVVGRDSDSDNIAAGSYNYLYLDPISANTPPGSTPQSVPSFFSTATGLDKKSETAVWNVDIIDGAVTAAWVNSDGTTTTPTVLFAQSNHIYAGGDPAAFQGRFPSPVTTVSLNFITL